METTRVLLVDDHSLVRQGLRAMLHTCEDIEVAGEASSGLEALAIARECKPHVVMMDIRMPGMDGLEATRQMNHLLPEVSVIILTIYESNDYILDAIQSGASGFVTKDAPAEFLQEAVRVVRRGGFVFKTHLLRDALSLPPRGRAPMPLPLPITISQLEDLPALTARQKSVLALIIQGKTNKEIGKALFISEETVKKHVQSVIAKLDASGRTDAAVKGLQARLFA